ncbi:MAG: hypothetical protein ABW321_25635 [Polyangiales bacterium]
MAWLPARELDGTRRDMRSVARTGETFLVGGSKLLAALCLCVTVSIAGSAAADGEAVLWMEDVGVPRPGLRAALQIQLGTDGILTDTWRGAGHLRARIDQANALAAQTGVTAVAWVEVEPPTSGERSASLYVVGVRAGRALLEVVSVPGSHTPDLERVLAMKLRELLGELRNNRSRSLLSAQPTRPPTAAEPSGLQLGFNAALGARLASTIGPTLTRAGLGVMLAPELCIGPWCSALGLGLDWYPRTTRADTNGELQVTELAPQLQLQLRRQTPIVDLSARTGLAWTHFWTDALTLRGTRESRSVRWLAWSVGLGISRRLSRVVALGLFADVLWQNTRHVYALNDTQLLDTGRLRVALGVDLILHWPSFAEPP